MDTTHRAAIGRIYCLIILFFISKYTNLAEAVTLEFCQVTDHMTSNASETGLIKSPGFGTRVRDPQGVPSLCTIYITVCPGCRLRLSNTTTIDCASVNSCFLRSASVEIEGVPTVKIFFNDSTSLLNVTSVGRSVSLVFHKSPNDAVTGQYGFYISYKVMRPEPIEYNFDPNRMSGSISSPGFPNRYASNEDIFTFLFEPSVAVNSIQLNFSDWYLSKYSKVKIQTDDINTTYDYLSDRPFVMTSQKPILVIFETGVGDTALNYIGFKATYLYSYDPPEGSSQPTTVGNDVMDSVFGGKIRFSVDGPGLVDYVWVIPRSELIGSDDTELKLRIDGTKNLSYDALKIHSGPTSDGAGVNWTIGNSLFSESGFYLRLRSKIYSSSIAFEAVFAWTRATAKCSHTDFRCQRSSECLKTRNLVCDGIKHCDDATDEIGCTAKKPVSTTILSSVDSNPYSNYATLSITLPLVMLGIIITIIVSFIICIAFRRKQHLSAIRRTACNEAPPGACNTNRNVNCGGALYIPNSGVVSPPSYTEVALYNNQGFTTSPGPPAPPPYTEFAKPLAPGELSPAPPPYSPSDEMLSSQPPREHSRTSPRRSGSTEPVDRRIC